VPKTGLEPVTY